jgi:tartrate dehydrogenase/decarboxylase/D-malate dehydrogenase
MSKPAASDIFEMRRGSVVGRAVVIDAVSQPQRSGSLLFRRWLCLVTFQAIEWASCEYYRRQGEMMRGDWKAQLSDMDAIYIGAVGWPQTVPDHISLWGSLLKFRREFDQYINLRPVRSS